MKKPTFDTFHPNCDACTNACDSAKQGKWRDALDWLAEATTALEYPENSNDNERATAYVNYLAEKAKVDLTTVPEKKRPPQPTAQKVAVEGLTVGEALQPLVHSTYDWLKKQQHDQKYNKYPDVSDYTVTVKRPHWHKSETLEQFSVGRGCVEPSEALVKLCHSPNTHYKQRSEHWTPSYEELVATDWQVVVTWEVYS